VPSQRDQYYNVLKRHEGADSPDLKPLEKPPVRDVKRIDQSYVGAVPGIEAAEDRKIQLPILGGEKN
jgi:cyclic dehypoxanthinyl futalosine synthase